MCCCTVLQRNERQSCRGGLSLVAEVNGCIVGMGIVVTRLPTLSAVAAAAQRGGEPEMIGVKW